MFSPAELFGSLTDAALDRQQESSQICSPRLTLTQNPARLTVVTQCPDALRFEDQSCKADHRVGEGPSDGPIWRCVLDVEPAPVDVDAVVALVVG